MKPVLFVRLALALVLALITGLTVVPASAACNLVASTGDDGEYRCSGDVFAYLDVGTGNDTVIIRNNATLWEEIFSQGGNLLVIVRPDGLIDSPYHGVYMLGDGQIVLDGRGEIRAAWEGAHLWGNGSIVMGPNLDLYADGIGLWLEGSGSISNSGYIEAGDLGIALGNVPAPENIEDLFTGTFDTSGTITNDGSVRGGQAGILLLGGGAIFNSGEVYSEQFGLALVGSGEIANTGYVDGVQIGTVLYGSGEINNYAGGEINADAVGILLMGRLPLTEDGLESLGFDGGGVINNWGEVGSRFVPTIGILLLGDGEINNYAGAHINSQLLGIGLYGNGTINNEARIQQTGIGVALIGELSYDDLAPIIGPIFSGEAPDLGGDFLSALPQLINSINFAGGGTINNSGNIRDVGLGLLLAGNGTINNEGRILGSQLGILLYGDGDINNSGNIRGSQIGIARIGQVRLDEDAPIFAPMALDAVPLPFLDMLGPLGAVLPYIDFAGGGNINNDARIVDNMLGILLVGDGAVNNSGIIRSEALGITMYGNGDINNSGRVRGGMAGILLIGEIGLDEDGNPTFGGGTINNSGIARGEMAGLALVGTGSINNSGRVRGGMAAILGAGDVTIVNEGDVRGQLLGIFSMGQTDIYTTGNVYGDFAGIFAMGDGTINVADGYVGGQVGIVGDDASQHVVINGVVEGGIGGMAPTMLDATVDEIRAAIVLNGGNDSAVLRANADVRGDILMGAGDDTVQIVRGSRVDGLIDGGEEVSEDVLIVGEGAYCREVSGSAELVAQARQLVSSLNPAGDTFSFGGNEYTIADFERAVAGERLIYCVGSIDDGRINPYDIGASIAGYCNVEDGVNVWDINGDGSGQGDISASGAEMRAALETAVNTGVNQLIAQGARGNSLWALSSNEYQMMGPDVNEPGKDYVFIFPAGRCGLGATLGS